MDANAAPGPTEETVQPDSVRVKEFWAGAPNLWRTSEIVHWTQHHKIQERFNLLASGSVHKNRFEYFMDTYCPDRPVERVLTLGSGHGELERGLSRYNFAKSYDGIDISEGAVEEARRLASSAGLKNIHYAVGDLNSVRLPRYQYDVVFASGSVHHVKALEHLLIQVSQTLKPNGYLFLDEYIGPNQFQWPDSQLAIINEQIELMPERLKVSVSRPHHVKGPVKRYTIDEMNAVDPSEAIRADNIVPLVRWLFDVIEIKGFGGSLLHQLLEHIMGNFDDDDQESIEYLYSLFEREDQLIASGKLQHDFALIIAKKKTTWRTRIRYSAHRLFSLLPGRQANATELQFD
jgi:SAM-dependent methyltransferase